MSKTQKPGNIKYAVLAVDTVLMTYKEGKLFIRLFNVHVPPYFINIAGLPGGLILPHETAEESSRRHILNKTGIDAKELYLEQVYTFTALKRDPRNRVVAVSYLGLVPWENLSQKEQDYTDGSWWHSIDSLPKLAYDHDEIIKVTLDRFRARLTYTTLISHILPSEFTLTELEEAYENFLGSKIDKRNFRKKIIRLKIVKKLKKKRTGLKARPAYLYSFTSNRVIQINIF